jgi:hypothetical protein
MMKTGWIGEQMFHFRFPIFVIRFPIVLWAALCTGTCRADEEDGNAPRLPVVGRPEFFDEEDGPIGAYQTPEVRVTPGEVQVEDPVTVAIRVAAAGPVQRPPKQIRFEKLPGFSAQFYIEYPDDPTFRRIDDRTWELICTLKPRGTNVTAVPSLPFAFFTPGFLPPERGYQVHRTASVPLVVRPRAVVQPSDVARGVEALPIPESVYRLAEGPDLLRPASVWSRASLMAASTAGLLLPPLVCVGWCLVWRRLHPGAARHARRRRSYAAQLALASLRGIEKQAHAPGPTARIVTQYLQQRFDLTPEEPTPAEVGMLLEQAGCDAGLTEQVVAYFRTCDAARFAHLSLVDSPAAAAQQLIQSLEEAPCPSHAS